MSSCTDCSGHLKRPRTEGAYLNASRRGRLHQKVCRKLRGNEGARVTASGQKRTLVAFSSNAKRRGRFVTLIHTKHAAQAWAIELSPRPTVLP